MSKIIYKKFITLGEVSNPSHIVYIRPKDVSFVEPINDDATLVSMENGEFRILKGNHASVVNELFDTEPQIAEDGSAHDNADNFATNEKWLEFMESFEDNPEQPLTAAQIVRTLNIKRDMHRMAVLNRINYYVNHGILVKVGVGKDALYFPNQEEWIAWREGLNKKLPF